MSKMEKLSKRIQNVASGFLELADNAEEKMDYLRLVCTAWNIANFDPPERFNKLQNYLIDFRSINNADPQACKDLEEDMMRLMNQKDILYPNDKRQIVDCQIQIVNGQENITIASHQISQPH